MNNLKAAVDRLAENTAYARELISDNTVRSLVKENALRDLPALETALSALRDAMQRQPDPDTGLVPCGCGGKVDIAFYPGWAGTPDLYQVDCFSCHVGTRPCQTAEQAKAAWNTAMGWKGSVDVERGGNK